MSAGKGTGRKPPKGVSYIVAWPTLDDVPGDAAEAVRRIEFALSQIVLDDEVCAQELELVLLEPPLPPLPMPNEGPPGEGMVGILRWYEATVARGLIDGLGPEPEVWEVQWVLRITRRAIRVARLRIEPLWDQPGRIDGWRDLMNWLKQRRMDQLAKAGIVGQRAADIAGMAKSSRSRAQNRKR